jgi:hypothetical protein
MFGMELSFRKYLFYGPRFLCHTYLLLLQEIACFSYDDKHQFRLDDSSIRYYYPPTLGADLSKGYDTFQNMDSTADDHLDSLLKTIIDLEQKSGKRVEADIITWRGMMTKVCLGLSPVSYKKHTHMLVDHGGNLQ